MTLRRPFLSLALQNNPLTLLGPISHLRWVGHAVDWKLFFTTLEASLSACNSLWFLWSKQHVGLHSENLNTLIDKYSDMAHLALSSDHGLFTARFITAGALCSNYCISGQGYL